jgi:putative transcriptional regulator
VILVCEHDDNKESFGLIINKPVDVLLSDVTDLSFENRLYVGGPVDQNRLHIVHTFEDLPQAQHIADGIYWGGDIDALKTYHLLGKLTDDNCRFLVGYSGWSKNQLKEEIADNVWIISRMNISKIFEIEPKEMWTSLLRNMGGQYRLLANYPTNPRLN